MDLPVTFTERRREAAPVNGKFREVEHYAFANSKGEKLIAFWLPGYVDENGRDRANFLSDVAIQGAGGKSASVIDVLNGTETPLMADQGVSDDLVLRKMRVRSWPLVIRLRK